MDRLKQLEARERVEIRPLPEAARKNTGIFIDDRHFRDGGAGDNLTATTGVICPVNGAKA